MKQDNGNNIYNNRLKQLTKILILAKKHFGMGNTKEHDRYLLFAVSILQKTLNPKDSLILEAVCLDIYDTNFIRSNINKINNKLTACFIAVKEWELFKNNKEQYLNDFKSTRIKDINADSIFEKSVKEIIRYLGSEKNVALRERIVNEFFETRQNKLRKIVIDFKKERTEFLSRYFNQ